MLAVRKIGGELSIGKRDAGRALDISEERRLSINALRALLGVRSESEQPGVRNSFPSRLLKPGEYLLRAGEVFESLFFVNAGYFKTVFTDLSGNEKILGFPTRGELIGIDGVDQSHHVNNVVALSDAQVVIVPYHQLISLGERNPEILTDLLRVVSHQLVEEQLAVTAGATLGVEAKVARFLLKLGSQMERQGYSPVCFNLRMSRQDMGNYLGMKLETVSRTLRQLIKNGLIAVDRREVTILDFSRLDDLARNKANQDSRKRPARNSVTVPGRRNAPNATPWSLLMDCSGDS